MQANRQTTVLFADVNSGTKLYESSRNAATAALIEVAESTGGRVVKCHGDEVMVLFTSPDAAASAASKMHAKIGALSAIGGTKLGVHVGFHSGPVGQCGMDEADETVKLALRLLEQAQDGQTITSQQTAEQLSPAFRAFSRSLYAMPVLEAAEEVRLCEVLSWHQRGVRPQGWSAMAVLRLTYRDQLVACSRENDSIVIGRERGCELIVHSKVASRRHCTIQCCDGDFVLRDHSSYGTYIAAANNTEIRLKMNKVSLPDQGFIAIGEPGASASDIVEFGYALVT